MSKQRKNTSKAPTKGNPAPKSKADGKAKPNAACGELIVAGKARQIAKMDAFVEGFKTFEKKRRQCEAQEAKYHLTAAEIERLPTIGQAIAALAEAKAQRARREALDAKTGGQYGALCDLADAFAAVLETKESREVFTWDEYPDPASAAKDFVSELEGRPRRVVEARKALLRTGYAVPDEWLTVDVDLSIVRPKPPPRFALTPPKSGAWCVYWCGVRDAAALDRCLRQVRAAMLRMENAPAAIAQTDTPPEVRALPRPEDGKDDQAKQATSAGSRTGEEKQCRHSDDFTSVLWFGKQYYFSAGQQAGAVRLLWEQWERGTPTLCQDTIATDLGVEGAFRLANVFRERRPVPGRKGRVKYAPHPAWGNMIITVGRGRFALKEPAE